MGDYHQGLPVGALKIIDGEENFTRTGEDGAEPIFSLKGTDKFFGEVMEGNWLKAIDGVITGPFTALITGGELQLTGRSAGGARYGWVYSQNRLYIFDDVVVDVHLKMPGHSAANNFEISFILDATQPTVNDPIGNDNDYLRVYLWTDNADYKIGVFKEVSGVSTELLVPTVVGNAEGTFRIKFEETKIGHLQTHIYYHVGAGDVDEDADEVAGSPFTPLALNFERAYVVYEFVTSENALRMVASEKLEIIYPDFSPKYELADADVNKGDCKIFDGDPDGVGVRVFDCDHDFSGDIYIQNGLVRLHIDDTVVRGLKFYGYISAAWVMPMDSIYPHIVINGIDLSYPFLKKIDYYSVDKIKVKIRLEDSEIQDGFFFADVTITLERGKPYFTLEVDEIYPMQNVRFFYLNASALRWGYAGDAEASGIGDDDLDLDGLNTTMGDNFMIAFDDAGVAALMVLVSNEKPDTRMEAEDGGDLNFRDHLPADLDNLKIFYAIIPFPLIANVFAEAEDEETDGTIEADGTASGGQRVMLNAFNEYVHWEWVAGTDLPIGRYLSIFRMKDLNQVFQDIRIGVWNATAGTFMNEENDNVFITLTGAWKYYQCVFDITEDDVGDTCRPYVVKRTGGANEVYVDHFLIIPIGNGESWPQDLAHSALRGRRQLKRVFER